jgi:RNA polymerase sigma-70 factor (ECF subfamily)
VEPSSLFAAIATEADARVLTLLWESKSRNFSGPARQTLGEVEDVGLLEAARRGDASAFSGLFARYQGPIFRYAAHMCGRDTADDIVQETFLAVLRGASQYDASRGPVAGYLFGIARHFVLKRMTARQMVSFDEEWDEAAITTERDQPSALETLTREETVAAVRVAIRSLPPSYREAIVLCELQEMSYEAAAGIAECPVGTIRSRLHRAKALLLSKLSAERR